MQAVIRKAEAHQDGWNPEVFGEVADDWNRPSRASEHGRLTENIAESLRCDANGRVIHIYHQAGAGAENSDRALNTLWRVLSNEPFHGFDDFSGILLRDEADADFRYGLCGNHSFGA